MSDAASLALLFVSRGSGGSTPIVDSLAARLRSYDGDIPDSPSDFFLW